MTAMHPLTQGSAAALTATGGTRLPAGKPPVLKQPPSPVLQQAGEPFNRLLQVLGQSQGQRSGSASLLSLVAALQLQLPAALPALLTSLQQQLQPHVLQPRQLSDAARLRQLVLQSGLFLEGSLADGALPEAVRNDLKLKLFQIVALLESNQPYLAAGGLLSPADRLTSAARSLQGKGQQTEAGTGSGQQRAGAYLQYSDSSRQGGIPDSALQLWLAQEARDALDELRQRQVRSGREGNDSVWHLELLLQQQNGVQPVPLEIRELGSLHPADWALQFRVELPQMGATQVRMRLCGNRVDVAISMAAEADAAALTRQRLAAAFAARHLQLAGLDSRGGE